MARQGIETYFEKEREGDMLKKLIHVEAITFGMSEPEPREAEPPEQEHFTRNRNLDWSHQDILPGAVVGAGTVVLP